MGSTKSIQPTAFAGVALMPLVSCYQCRKPRAVAADGRLVRGRPPHLDEIAHIGLAVEASLCIGVPRLAAAKAARMQTVAHDLT